jgi:ACT domain-containing protein
MNQSAYFTGSQTTACGPNPVRENFYAARSALWKYAHNIIFNFINCFKNQNKSLSVTVNSAICRKILKVMVFIRQTLVDDY